MDFKVLSRMKLPRVIPVSVNSNGTLAIAMPHITSAKTATGEYTLTIKPSYQEQPFAWGTAVKGAGTRKFVEVDKATLTPNTIKFKTFTTGDVAADAAFHAFIIGPDGKSPIFGNVVQPVRIPMNRARMLFFSYAGGTDAMQAGLNPHEGTMTKAGTGLYSLSLRQPFFANAVVHIQCSTITRVAEIVSMDHKTLSIEVVNATSGVAADDTIFITIIGQRSRTVGQKMLYPLYCPHAFTYLNPFEYDGVGDAMVRGTAYISKSKAAQTYTFTTPRASQKAEYGLVSTDGAGIVSAVNTRTVSGFNVDVEADATVYGLEIAMKRGRNWG